MRVASIIAVVMTAACVVSTQARADGDPASDILTQQNVFYPYDPPVAPQLQTALNGAVAAAHRAGFPLKVALISTPADLGAVPGLFAEPERYARYLGTELEYFGRPPVLVVMPDGIGVAHVGRRHVQLAMPRRDAPQVSNALAYAALMAVPRLAGLTVRSITVGLPSATDRSLALIVFTAAGVSLLLAVGVLVLRRPR